MFFRVFVVTIYALCACWFEGVHLAEAQNARTQALVKAEQEKPYRAVMQDAVNALQQYGITVKMPKELPALVTCNECLKQREAFGAFTEKADQVIVPSDFNVATLEGRSVLIHEYGHYLLTQAGIPADRQERICLTLGNHIYQKLFTAALSN